MRLQEFWDKAFLAALPLWGHVRVEPPGGATNTWTAARQAAYIADEAVKAREHRLKSGEFTP